jgi:hypothetical protein
VSERYQSTSKPTKQSDTPKSESDHPLKTLEWQGHNLEENARTEKDGAVRKERDRKLPAARLEMSGNRSREWARHNTKGSSNYLVLASVRLRPGIEDEKCERGKHDVKSKKDIQMDSAESMEQTMHSRLTPQAQRPGTRDATIANRDAMPGSLQRMVRPRHRHHQNLHQGLRLDATCC